MSGKLTANLQTPCNKGEFTTEWARKIIVDYTKKTDPDWLLASCVKVFNVNVKDNPHPGEFLKAFAKVFATLHLLLKVCSVIPMLLMCCIQLKQMENKLWSVGLLR